MLVDSRMDIPWGSDAAAKFITNVGLVTSSGPNGQNIMAAEWTHHVSYRPGLVAVCLGPDRATTKNIRTTKEFGISICSIDQSVMSSVSGGYSGKDTDKIAALKELGFSFYEGKKIGALMVAEAAANVECKLFKEVELGDHIMFVGEAVSVSAGENDPLALYGGRYWKMSDPLTKPSEKRRAEISDTVSSHAK